MSREYTINGQTKRTAHTGNNISAVYSPEYFRCWQYPPYLLRAPAVPALLKPEILWSSGSIEVQNPKYSEYYNTRSQGSIEQ